MVLGILGSCIPLLARMNPKAGEAANAGAPSQPVTIDKLQVIPSLNDVQVAVSESRTVVPSITTLSRPTRIVLTFPNILSALGYDRLEVKQHGIKTVRVGRHENPPTTRIVLDLATDLHYSLSSDDHGVKLTLSRVAAPAVKTEPPPSIDQPEPFQQGAPVIESPSDATLISVAQKSDDHTAISAPSDSEGKPASPTTQAQASRDLQSSDFLQDGRMASSAEAAEQVGVAPKDALLLPASKTPQPLPDSTMVESVMNQRAEEPMQVAGAGVPKPSSSNRTPSTLVPNAADVSADYVVGPEDVLAIDVWREPEISKTVPVRPDGKISLPLVGELSVSGMTALDIHAVIIDRLQQYMSTPEVSVVVQTIKSHYVNVMGQVLKPGSLVLAKQMTVLDALAQTGGFKDFAKLKKIYVLRTTADGNIIRLPFNYKEVIKGKQLDENVQLQVRDTVVVP